MLAEQDLDEQDNQRPFHLQLDVCESERRLKFSNW